MTCLVFKLRTTALLVCFQTFHTSKPFQISSMSSIQNLQILLLFYALGIRHSTGRVQSSFSRSQQSSILHFSHGCGWFIWIIRNTHSMWPAYRLHRPIPGWLLQCCMMLLRVFTKPEVDALRMQSLGWLFAQFFDYLLTFFYGQAHVVSFQDTWVLLRWILVTCHMGSCLIMVIIVLSSDGSNNKSFCGVDVEWLINLELNDWTDIHAKHFSTDLQQLFWSIRAECLTPSRFLEYFLFATPC